MRSRRLAFWLLLFAAVFPPVAWVSAWTSSFQAWHATAPRVLLVLGTVVGFSVCLARVARWVEARLSRRARQRAAALERFREAAPAGTPLEVLPSLETALEELGLRLVAAALADERGAGAYTVLSPPTGDEATLGPAPVTAPLPADLVVRAARPAPWLDAFGADVLVPLRRRGEPMGAIFARGRVPADARADLERLGALAGLAFTNAALHHEVERRAEHLEEEVRDRTAALQRALEELGAAQARVVEAEKQAALGLLVAGVSHEINNALNFIYGNLPVLLRYLETYLELWARAPGGGAGPPPEVEAAAARLREQIEVASVAAARAKAIIDDLRRRTRAHTAVG